MEGYLEPQRIAPIAAKDEPIIKVDDITLLILIPISLAVSKSFETALIAIPILVLLVMKSTAYKRMRVTKGVIKVAIVNERPLFSLLSSIP